MNGGRSRRGTTCGSCHRSLRSRATPGGRRIMPQWKVWTFYCRAFCMSALYAMLRQCSGTSGRQQIFPHGEIISNALPSRRLLFDRLGLGDGSCSCSVRKLFDDNNQNEAYMEADCWFTEEEETAHRYDAEEKQRYYKCPRSPLPGTACCRGVGTVQRLTSR